MDTTEHLSAIPQEPVRSKNPLDLRIALISLHHTLIAADLDPMDFRLQVPAESWERFYHELNPYDTSVDIPRKMEFLGMKLEPVE